MKKLFYLESLLITAIIGLGFFWGRTRTRWHTLEKTVSRQSQTLADTSVLRSANYLKLVALAASLTRLTHDLALTDSQIKNFNTKLLARRKTIEIFATKLRTTETLAHERSPIVPMPSPKAEHFQLQQERDGPPPFINPAIPIPSSFLAHRNSNGELDYWIAPRVDSQGESSVRIRPYQVSPVGLLVHNLDDGKDYIITEQGGWTEIPSKP